MPCVGLPCATGETCASERRKARMGKVRGPWMWKEKRSPSVPGRTSSLPPLSLVRPLACFLESVDATDLTLKPSYRPLGIPYSMEPVAGTATPLSLKLEVWDGDLPRRFLVSVWVSHAKGRECTLSKGPYLPACSPATLLSRSIHVSTGHVNRVLTSSHTCQLCHSRTHPL
jgi:hypothetical protein